MSIRTWFAGKQLASAERELESTKGRLEQALRTETELKGDLRALREELENLKLKKKIEEEDIKHLVKIKLEQNEIEFQKKLMQNDREKDSAVSKIKQDYADKLQARLEIEVANIKEMYGQILQRLPDVNVRLKGDI